MRKKTYSALTRMTALLLVLVCMLGLLPSTALAANPSTIKMDDCAYSGTKYDSPALGECYMHQMHFNYDGKSTMGFCAEKGKGMGWSLKGHTWGNPQPISDPTVKTMMAYPRPSGFQLRERGHRGKVPQQRPELLPAD